MAASFAQFLYQHHSDLFLCLSHFNSLQEFFHRSLRGVNCFFHCGDFTLVYVGARDDVDPITFERAEAGSYTTGDIALAYSLWDGVEVTGRVLNVLDKDYQEVLGYPAQGRRYFFGLRLGVDTPARWRGTP